MSRADSDAGWRDCDCTDAVACRVGTCRPAAPAAEADLRAELAAYLWCGIGPWERAKDFDREPYWRMADDILALPALQRLVEQAAEAARLRVCSGCSMPDGRHSDTCPNRHDGRPTR